MNEKQAIQGCIKGDSRCQHYLYKQYYPLMSSLSLRYSVSVEDAKQNLNFAYLRVLQNLHKYNSDFSLATFIKTIFIRFLIDEYRKKTKDQAWQSVDELKQSETPVVLNLGEESLDSNDLFKLLETLPKTSKTVFCLYAIDGYQYNEISDVLKITEATCRWHVNNARQLLKEQIHKKKLTTNSRTA